MRTFAIALLLVLSGFAAGVTGAGAETAAAGADAGYLIQAGDELDVRFFYHESLNDRLRVRPDGRITLQMIGDIDARGLTPERLAEALEERFASELRDPEITVVVRSFGQQRVFVDGQVTRPGEVALLAPLTARQAIAVAGGATATARLKQVLIVRGSATGAPQVLEIDLRKPNGAQAVAETALLPLDVVYVPRRRIANVNRWVDHYIRQNIPFSGGIVYTP